MCLTKSLLISIASGCRLGHHRQVAELDHVVAGDAAAVRGER